MIRLLMPKRGGRTGAQQASTKNIGKRSAIRPEPLDDGDDFVINEST